MKGHKIYKENFRISLHCRILESSPESEALVKNAENVNEKSPKIEIGKSANIISEKTYPFFFFFFNFSIFYDP